MQAVPVWQNRDLRTKRNVDIAAAEAFSAAALFLDESRCAGFPDRQSAESRMAAWGGRPYNRRMNVRLP
jgi:hypothetical protein